MLNMLSKLRRKRATGDNGFTLIELLVVVVIIGILIAIAIPLYLNYRKGANDKSAQSDLRGAISTLEQCNSDNGSYPAAVGSAGQFTATNAPCTGQIVKLSGGTTYWYTPAGSPPNSYIMTTTNSGGSKVYCYNSANGGSVSTLSGAATTLVAVTTC